jgi:uncharacterized protein YdaU (DUF1376 family)
MEKLGYTFYPKDYISDPDVMMMTPAERGVYRDLIDLAYMHDNQIKYNLFQLSRYCNCTEKEVQDVLNLKGKKVGEFWTIPSCEKRIAKAKVNRENGGKGGRPPKPKDNPNNNPTNNPNNNPNKTQTKRQRERESEKEIESESEKEIETEFIPFWDEFLAYAVDKKPKVNKQDLKLKYEAWRESGWKVNRAGKMQNIVNWKTTLLNTLPHIKESSPTGHPEFKIAL